jgi:cytochrome b pre-mRNA-processing protein 3
MAFDSLFSRRRHDEAAARLYEVAVNQARLPVFYQSLGVGDTVDGRFDLIALHVFLLLFRLGQSGAAAKKLSQALFDLMFSDMEANLREMGVSDLAVGGRVKTMAKAFYGRVSAYESCLDDPRRMEEALSRNLYRGQAPSAAALVAMAAYVCGEVRALAEQPLEALADGQVSFGAPLLPEGVS